MEKQHNEEAEGDKITSPSLGPSGQYINPSAGEQGKKTLNPIKQLENLQASQQSAA